jgi:hypothetical protein
LSYDLLYSAVHSAFFYDEAVLLAVSMIFFGLLFLGTVFASFLVFAVNLWSVIIADYKKVEGTVPLKFYFSSKIFVPDFLSRIIFVKNYNDIF